MSEDGATAHHTKKEMKAAGPPPKNSSKDCSRASELVLLTLSVSHISNCMVKRKSKRADAMNETVAMNEAPHE